MCIAIDSPDPKASSFLLRQPCNTQRCAFSCCRCATILPLNRVRHLLSALYTSTMPCTCTGCAGSPGCVPVLGQPHFASPFVRSHFFSVAPQHSDFTLQHHFSCAVKSDFNESRSSGQYFRLCECVGRHCPRTPQLVQSLALRSIGARDGPRWPPARTRRVLAIRCGQSYVFCSRLWKTAAAPPSSTTQPDCDLHRSLAAVVSCQQNLHLTMPQVGKHAPCQNVSSLPAVLFNLALSHFSQPLHSASS